MKNSKIVLLLIFLISSAINADDLSFSIAYDLALQNNNSIKSSQYQAKAVEEQINQEESRLYPQLDFSSYYSRSQYNRRGNNVNDIIDQGLINYTFSLQQSIYDPNIYSRIDIQNSKSKLSTAKLNTQKANLAKEVFASYIDILKSNSKTEALNIYMKLTESKLNEYSKKYKMNLASRVDLLQIKVDYNAAKIALKKEQQQHDVALLKLKQLVGESNFTLPKINVEKPIIETVEKMQFYVNKIHDNLKLNLNIKEAELSTKLAFEEINNAYSGHLPKVNLNASYSHYNTDTPTIDFSYDSIARVMITLDIPIYSGGYVSSSVKSSKLFNQSSNEDLIDTKKQAILQRDESLSRFNSAIETINLFQETFESAQLYYDAVKQSFDHGLKSRVDLNDANNKLYKIKYQYIENISEIVDSYISLLIVTNQLDGISILDNLII